MVAVGQASVVIFVLEVIGIARVTVLLQNLVLTTVMSNGTNVVAFGTQEKKRSCVIGINTN